MYSVILLLLQVGEHLRPPLDLTEAPGDDSTNTELFAFQGLIAARKAHHGLHVDIRGQSILESSTATAT